MVFSCDVGMPSTTIHLPHAPHHVHLPDGQLLGVDPAPSITTVLDEIQANLKTENTTHDDSDSPKNTRSSASFVISGDDRSVRGAHRTDRGLHPAHQDTDAGKGLCQPVGRGDHVRRSDLWSVGRDGGRRRGHGAGRSVGRIRTLRAAEHGRARRGGFFDRLVGAREAYRRRDGYRLVGRLGGDGVDLPGGRRAVLHRLGACAG